MKNANRKVCIVQQGVWNMQLESMPLAAGYLKAYAQTDSRVESECDIRILSLDGGDTTLTMVEKLLFAEIPNVVAFSVLGWNYTKFKKVAEAFKQFNPRGWVIFGGNHVSHQAQRIFQEAPAVDIVVNGEGELTFREILSAFVAGAPTSELHDIDGVSFRSGEGDIVTTAPRSRIVDLDIIPSPVLSGAIPLLDDEGKFRYDVAIMETNRGCPYKCAYCYWGGAIGQKVRRFSRARLRAELELYGRLGVNDIILCDANFGMLRQDRDFVEDLIEVRGKYGFPRNFESSWAKNKSDVFFGIVRRMKEAGFHSNFTLALQTLTSSALTLMRRDNMKVNAWEDLASWLRKEGMECYAELIWGCPGETYETFIEGYDKLARRVYRIATYPHLLMPNTDYTDKREQYEFRTLRGEHDDFEYVLSHCTMSIEDNRKMLRFLFWARLMAEYMVFRDLWTALVELEDITQSQVLLSLDAWLDAQDDDVARGLQRCRAEVVDSFDLSRVSTGIRYVASEPGIDEYLLKWWNGSFRSRISEARADFMTAVLEYDLCTRPVLDEDEAYRTRRAPSRESVQVNGVSYYVRRDQTLRYDLPALLADIRGGEQPELQPEAITVDLHYKAGFKDFVDNHEFYPQFVGKTTEQLARQAQAAPKAFSRAIKLDPTRVVVEDHLRRYREDSIRARPAEPQGPEWVAGAGGGLRVLQAPSDRGEG